MLQISEVTQHFQSCFTDYDRGTWAVKMFEAIRVIAQLSIPLSGEK